LRIFSLFMLCGVLAAFFMIGNAGHAAPPLQDPTVTPEGPQIIVPEQVNVRLGPSIEYELVGVLISGQRATALGRSPGSEWIQIEYPGVPGNVAWVYEPFVELETSQRILPIIEPPPTPTPLETATIDPTLAAQFNIGEAVPTRLPTFTPAGAVVYPTFEPVAQSQGQGFPPILVILALMTLGVFGLFVSFLRGR
jgi:hypothetical protein